MIEMEKTNRDKKSISIKGSRGKKTHHPGVEIVHSRFYDELKFAETQKLNLEFDNLIDEITKQGEKFSKNPTMENLQLYKSIIKEFLQYVTDRMFQVEHYTGGRMKQKIYTVARIVDQKLGELTEAVLSQQAHNIDLLATLDEIRGLLIDLYK